MGRSVSVPGNASWVVYARQPMEMVYICDECSMSTCDQDEPCEECGGQDFTFSESESIIQAHDQYECDKETIQSVLGAAFPSLKVCDEFIGREDLALLENGHAYIGVSSYGSVMSIWCVPKADQFYYSDDPVMEGLREHWCASIEKKATALLAENFSLFNRCGVMSNGEAVYKAA
jgi:hypothetical protein